VFNQNFIPAKALSFATKAHAGQLRKYTGEPYINHPISVAILVFSVDKRRSSITAALLHDVVEDTKYEKDDIIKHFGTQIADLVEELTDVSRPSDGNREVRKRMDRERLAMVSPQAKTIKLADLIDNSFSIIEYDPKFAKTYIAEKKLLLDVLADGNKTLLNSALAIISHYYLTGKTLLPNWGK